jgi:hypothetical protein
MVAPSEKPTDEVSTEMDSCFACPEQLKVDSSPSCCRAEIQKSIGSTYRPVVPNPHRLRQPRHVQFLVDDLDRDLLEVIEYELPPLEEWPDLYCTQEDKLEFLNTAREQVAQVTNQNPRGIQKLEYAFHNCGSKAGLGSSASGNVTKDIHNLREWAQSTGRGLEDSVTAMFLAQRCEYIGNVIQYATFLKEFAAENSTCIVDGDQALRRYAEGQTRRSREFAYKMALADELALQ